MKLFLQMSMMAGILILLVTVIRAAAINRLPKRCFVWLWAVVILRLLIPVSVDVEIRGLPQDSAVFAGRRVIEHIVPSEQEMAVQRAWSKDAGAAGKRISDDGRAGSSTTAGAFAPEADAGYKAGGLNGFGGFWERWGWSLILAAGSVICLLIYVIRYMRGYRLLLEAIPLKGAAWEDMCLTGGRRSKSPVLLVSDRIATPVTFGFFKPRIVLPKGMLAAGKDQLEFILQHEMVHIRRHDNLLIFAGGCAACIHWFNPLVWLMRSLLVRDIEISCDEKVISKLGESKKAGYAISLIEAAGKTKGQPAMFSAFGKTAIQERIVSIMKYRKTSIISISAAVILTISSLTVFAAAKGDSSASYIVPVKTAAAGAEQENGAALAKESSQEKAAITAKGTSQEKGTTLLKEGSQEKAGAGQKEEIQEIREINAAQLKEESQEQNATLLKEDSQGNTATLQGEEIQEINAAQLKGNTELIAAGEDSTAEEAAAKVEECAAVLETLQEKMKTANKENGDYDRYKEEYDSMLDEYDAAVEDWVRKDIVESAAEYGKYGLTYDEAADCFYLDGEPVRCIEDGSCYGNKLKGYICHQENGTVDVSICRDENHKITGIEHCAAGDSETASGHHSEKHESEELHHYEHEHRHGEGNYILKQE